MLAVATFLVTSLAAPTTGTPSVGPNLGEVSAPVTVDRLSGADRYETALRLAQEYEPGVPVVYVASGLSYADALSAGPAAAYRGGPLLLTPPSQAPSRVVDEVRRLRPQRIVVVGGYGAVAQRVQVQLDGIAPTDRVSGQDRYETSRAVVLDAFGAAISDPGYSRVAFLATGRGYADALSAAAVAGANGGFVLLVDGEAPLTAAADGLLDATHVTKVVLVGGIGALGKQIEDTLLLTRYSAVGRVGGKDRYDTSARISAWGFAEAPRAFVATGTQFADALSGAALAGAVGAPLLVTPPTCLSVPSVGSLRTLGTSRVTLLGGAGALDPAVGRLEQCGSGPALLDPRTGTVPSPRIPTIVERYSLGDRYADAVAVSRRYFPHGARVVHVVGEQPTAAALSAPAAAAAYPGPLFAVPRDSLPAVVRDEIIRLGASHVVVVGGTDEVSDAVLNELGTLVWGARRVTGADPESASLAVASSVGLSDRVVLASVDAPGDALVASVVAGIGSRASAILVDGSAPTAREELVSRLRTARAGTVTVVGDEEAIGEAFLEDLTARTGAVVARRITGPNVYETSVTAVEPHLGGVIGVPAVPADALPALTAGAHLGSSVVVLPRDCVPRRLAAALSAPEPGSVLRLHGSTSLLGPGVESITPCP
ncbi:cell wall-binding repeat-containing protein [Cellulosimicrobium funkei]|uniref:cell wall-binding repeat-containing protein n=1 Tax=Cellulosimicrobium funkei TaxID=264251 RepID=UPI0036CB55BF